MKRKRRSDSKKREWTKAYIQGYQAGYKRALRRLEGVEPRPSAVKKVKSEDYLAGERNGKRAARQRVKRRVGRKKLKEA